MRFFSKLFFGSGRPPEPVEDPDDSILRSLRDSGLDLGVERPVDFFLYFPGEPAAMAAASVLRARGFVVEPHAPPDADADWLLMLQKALIISRPAIKALRADLDSIARAHGGEFEGWDAAELS